TFHSVGNKKISCETYDRKGAVSRSVERIINIGCGSPWADCREPETEINISVRSSDTNRINMERNSCRPFCQPEQEISFHEPYLPQYETDQIDNVFNRAAYTLRGTVVYNNNGRPVQNARVYIRSPESGRQYSTTTDSYGEYMIKIDQEKPYYRLQAAKDGLQSQTRRIYTDDASNVTLRISNDSFPNQEYQQSYSNEFSRFDLP
ncbi:MAG: carboxypeptidase regulatory-like domain-containing protein, partial [Candidatus Electrothrix sp. AR3]|nr:carboxypeptidase regulatory-like domain-containing protein [Candidatus Electrothrix sp. AR3]